MACCWLYRRRLLGIAVECRVWRRFFFFSFFCSERVSSRPLALRWHCFRVLWGGLYLAPLIVRASEGRGEERRSKIKGEGEVARARVCVCGRTPQVVRMRGSGVAYHFSLSRCFFFRFLCGSCPRIHLANLGDCPSPLSSLVAFFGRPDLTWTPAGSQLARPLLPRVARIFVSSGRRSGYNNLPASMPFFPWTERIG